MLENNVSVVMVSFNTGPILFRSIESVLIQEGLKELIIVDNGNPERVKNKLTNIAAKDARLKIMTGHGNIGFAAGCNLGAKNALGKYLLLLNPDCIIPKNALTKVRDVLASKDEAWLAGCAIVNPDGSEQSGSRRNILTPMVALVEALKLYILFPSNQYFKRMHYVENSQIEESFVPAISGAFMMLTKENYDQLGGIDEGYFFHVEDLDFCFQISKAGKKIVFVPTVKSVHFRSTSDVSSYFVEKYKAKGFVRYFKKNFGNKYFPGFLHLLTIGIYLRFVSRLAIVFFNKLFNKSDLDFLPDRHAVQLQFLEAYKNLNIDKKLLENSGPALVVGSTGQVGLSILQKLIAAGQKTYAFFHSEVIDFSNENLTWVQGDLNLEDLKISEFRPQTLFYTPALWLLPPHIEKLASAGIKRIICFSSTSIFGKATSRNTYEQKLVARLVQAEKDIAEKCEKLGIKYTIFRPTMIYGIGLDRNVSSILRFINKYKLFPIFPPASGLRQPVHTDDLAMAAISSVGNEKTFNKSYNLCGGEKITYREMVERIYINAGKTPKIIAMQFLPFVLDIYAKILFRDDLNGEIARRMNTDLVFDDEPAKTDFSYNPRKFL